MPSAITFIQSLYNIIMMEHLFKKHASHYKFNDYFKPSPIKMDASYQKTPSRKTTSKHKSGGLYTQISASSRVNNKVSASTHHSPKKAKPEKLLKTSVLNYLHKCRSEYEETNSLFARPKSSCNIKSANVTEHSEKTTKCIYAPKNSQLELFDRTHELLCMYKDRCLELQTSKQACKGRLEQANSRIKQLQKNLNKLKRQRKSMQKDK